MQAGQEVISVFARETYSMSMTKSGGCLITGSNMDREDVGKFMELCEQQRDRYLLEQPLGVR